MCLHVKGTLDVVHFILAEYGLVARARQPRSYVGTVKFDLKMYIMSDTLDAAHLFLQKDR